MADTGELRGALTSPLLRQVLAYWEGKRGRREMPARRDIDVVEIPRLLPHIILIDVLRDPLDFRYRLIGSGVREILRRDYTGKLFSEIPGKGRNSIIWGNCERVVATRRPFSRTPPYVGPKQDVQPHENLLLPLSENGVTVDMILYAIDCVRKSHLDLPFG